MAIMAVEANHKNLVSSNSNCFRMATSCSHNMMNPELFWNTFFHQCRWQAWLFGVEGKWLLENTQPAPWCAWMPPLGITIYTILVIYSVLYYCTPLVFPWRRQKKNKEQFFEIKNMLFMGSLNMVAKWKQCWEEEWYCAWGDTKNEGLLLPLYLVCKLLVTLGGEVSWIK